MVSHEAAYRLGEFILVEHNRILLTWLLQSPMGMQQSGKCYVVGNILIILPCHLRNPGYLRLEYSINLSKLPLWHKTTFYCFANSLHQVIGRRPVTTEMIEHLALNAIESDLSENTEPGAFRLGRHKIIVNKKSELSWQALGLNNKVRRGLCSLNSGILILESGKQELEQTTRTSFYQELRSLPPWNQTTAWGFSGAVKHCKEPKLSRIASETERQSKTAKSLISEKIPVILLKNSEAEKYSQLRLPKKEPYKIEWEPILKLLNQNIKKNFGRLDRAALFLKRGIHFMKNKLKVIKH